MPGTWLDARFPGSGDGLRRGLAHGLQAGCSEAATEYFGGRYRDATVYGVARHKYGLRATADAVQTETGAAIFPVYGRPYAVLGGALIYPWCYGNSLDLEPQDVVMNVSQLRADLFAARQVRRAPFQTRMDIASDDGTVTFNLGLEDEDEEEPLTALLVAYSSNPNAGLLRVVAGDVDLYEDGHLDWRQTEDVPLLQAAAPGGLYVAGGHSVSDDLNKQPEWDIDLGEYEDERGVQARGSDDVSGADEQERTRYDDPNRDDDDGDTGRTREGDRS